MRTSPALLVTSAVLGFTAAIGVIGYATLAHPAAGDAALDRSRAERASFPQPAPAADPNARLRDVEIAPAAPVATQPAPVGVPVAEPQPAAPVLQLAVGDDEQDDEHGDVGESDGEREGGD